MFPLFLRGKYTHLAAFWETFILRERAAAQRHTRSSQSNTELREGRFKLIYSKAGHNLVSGSACYFEKRLDACRVSGGRRAEQEAGQDGVGVALLAGEG